MICGTLLSEGLRISPLNYSLDIELQHERNQRIMAPRNKVFSLSKSTVIHCRLEELRKLNYALDIELQRERNQRVSMQERVMAPRNRQAAQALVIKTTFLRFSCRLYIYMVFCQCRGSEAISFGEPLSMRNRVYFF
jgi:hypothetical protein